MSHRAGDRGFEQSGSFQRTLGNQATLRLMAQRTRAKRTKVRLHTGLLEAREGGGSAHRGIAMLPFSQIGSADAGLSPEPEGNAFGDTGQGPAPAGGAAPAAAACGCCVSSVSISNVARFDNATHMGHSFDVTIDMAYPMVLRSPGSGHCRLQWFEKTNVPYFPGMVANAWNDMSARMPNSPTLAPWVNRDETCGSTHGVTVTDTPALGKRPGRTVTRTLQFNIVVSSSSGGCGTASANATATQTLTMANGAANWAASSFVTP